MYILQINPSFEEIRVNLTNIQCFLLLFQRLFSTYRQMLITPLFPRMSATLFDYPMIWFNKGGHGGLTEYTHRFKLQAQNFIRKGYFVKLSFLVLIALLRWNNSFLVLFVLLKVFLKFVDLECYRLKLQLHFLKCIVRLCWEICRLGIANSFTIFRNRAWSNHSQHQQQCWPGGLCTARVSKSRVYY